jgi:hypothetical protein
MHRYSQPCVRSFLDDLPGHLLIPRGKADGYWIEWDISGWCLLERNGGGRLPRRFLGRAIFPLRFVGQMRSASGCDPAGGTGVRSRTTERLQSRHAALVRCEAGFAAVASLHRFRPGPGYAPHQLTLTPTTPTYTVRLAQQTPGHVNDCGEKLAVQEEVKSVARVGSKRTTGDGNRRRARTMDEGNGQMAQRSEDRQEQSRDANENHLPQRSHRGRREQNCPCSHALV